MGSENLRCVTVQVAIENQNNKHNNSQQNDETQEQLSHDGRFFLFAHNFRKISFFCVSFFVVKVTDLITTVETIPVAGIVVIIVFTATTE